MYLYFKSNNVIHLILSVAIIIFASACNSAVAPKASESVTLSCSKDSDCEVTVLIAGKCCGHLCQPNSVYNKNYLKKVVQDFNQMCNNEECPVADCPKPFTRNEAVCNNGKCEIQKVSLR